MEEIAEPFDDDEDVDECFNRSFEVMRFCSFEDSMVTSSVRDDGQYQGE